ncbi:MAG: LuxR C-terminal-related transcriptional regulator, partial [Alistipes sp.]|nr:LuxR C-terminal-related transcriptional regulator [Alistipes sp.]
YTDLHEGNYRFEVRVPESDAADEPVVASLAFRVLPPWYRSPVMYAVYFLLVVAVVLCLYEYAYGRQRAIVRRQQQEMKQKNQEIKHLEEESIRAELRHKTEELARTTLNIVRKNEILQRIRKEAGNILRAAKEEDLVHIRRSTARLIDNIDTNLEHDNDIKHFEETFDSVHRDFFKHLDEYGPTLSKQEKMLCAYIRIGMLSKEIAPLLNISVRGVEISRYRLRKKLGLEEGTSLTAFLQKM